MTLSNGGLSGEIQGYVDRIENLDAEIKALQQDRKDVFDDAVSSTGLSKTAFTNILKERKTAPSLVHATYTDMDAIRRALKMRDPLLPVEEVEERSPRQGGWGTLGEALDQLYAGA